MKLLSILQQNIRKLSGNVDYLPIPTSKYQHIYTNILLNIQIVKRKLTQIIEIQITLTVCVTDPKSLIFLAIT